MFKTCKTALCTLLLFTVLLGGIYPLAVFLIGQTFFSFHANGSLLFSPKNQTLIGSSLIAQPFESPQYFHPRPSATNYDGIHSGASNLSPTSSALLDLIQKRSKSYHEINGLSPGLLIPIDAVTASGSGVDPHISISNALLQIPRIAKARRISEEQVARLIEKHTTRESFGILGQPRINVLLLNLSLDRYQYEKVQ